MRGAVFIFGVVATSLAWFMAFGTVIDINKGPAIWWALAALAGHGAFQLANHLVGEEVSWDTAKWMFVIFLITAAIQGA